MHLILTGATGLVGSAVLDAMIKMKDVTKITILSRRPVKMAEDVGDPRVNVIIHKDFEMYDSDLLDKLRGAKGCIWALGISSTQVSKEDYVKITKTYALAAARAFQSGLLPPADASQGASSPSPLPPPPQQQQPSFHFVYVSGEGTTMTPGRLTPLFARVKGETELALADMRAADARFRAATVRPGFVDPAAHPAIQPYLPVPSLAIRVATAILGPVARAFFPANCSPTHEFGPFLACMAAGRWEAEALAAAGAKVQTVGAGRFPVVRSADVVQVTGSASGSGAP